MAQRPVFVPKFDRIGVDVLSVDFEWFPGFSQSQKQKSIQSLHAGARRSGIQRPLEVSTKSTQQAGQQLSAFNLRLRTESGEHPVELVFQSSKVFEDGGPNPHLLAMAPSDARRYAGQSGRLVAFEFEGFRWPLEPRTAFYDWVYLRALRDNPELRDLLDEFDGFTDIEFNPEKSINCQAASCALQRSLDRSNVGFSDLADPSEFIAAAQSFHFPTRMTQQTTLRMFEDDVTQEL